LGGAEYEWVINNTESLEEFLEGFETVDELREYLL
jgi:hypothetical protein